MPRTPQLSDLQRVVLARAAKRDNRHALPLPAAITDDERTRTQITDLIKRKLLAEHEVSPRAPYWHAEGDGRIGLVVTAAGCAAIGIDLTDGEADQQSTHDASLPAAATAPCRQGRPARPRALAGVFRKSAHAARAGEPHLAASLRARPGRHGK